MNIFRQIATLLFTAGICQAGTLYYQDFSSSTPVSDQVANNPITDGTQVTTMVAGEIITGGNSGDQATNGDYTITINTASAASDYYIFNETGDLGFKYDDAQYTFESGIISFEDEGTTYTGTITLKSVCNVGNEFFSINSVELIQDEQNGEVYVDIDFNFYADIAEGQTDSLLLTLDFGINDITNLQIEELVGVPLDANTSGSGVYRHSILDALETTLYYQDFSNSTPVSDQPANNPISDDTPVTTMVAGEVISGGDSGNQPTNGDYTITINTVYGQSDHYIFNEATDPGFKYDDAQYTFLSGNIAFLDGSIPYNGTIKLQSKCNVGDEFFSINSVKLVRYERTGAVFLDIDFNYYADTEEGGTDSLLLTLDFGINDVVNLQIEELIGEPLATNSTGAGVYRHGLVEVLQPVSFEPESLTLNGFNVESQPDASDGQVIVLGGASGSAAGVPVLAGDGYYDIHVGYFDENDGTGVYKLLLDDTLIDAWSSRRDLGLAEPGPGNLVIHKTLRVLVGDGQTLGLLAYSDGGEPCRVDSIELIPSSKDIPPHSMSWSSDGSINSLRLNDQEHVDTTPSLTELRIFNGDDMRGWDMIDASEQSGVVEIVDESGGLAKMYFRAEAYDHHLLLRMVGVEQIPNINSINARLTLPISNTVHVVSLDDNAEVDISASELQFDWTKFGERNRFPGGMFALYADGTTEEMDAAIQEIDDLYGDNPAPIADALNVVTKQDVPVAITLTGSDHDGADLNFNITSLPSNGSLSGDAPNLTYTPNSAFDGVDSFTYTVDNGNLTSTPATVEITVYTDSLQAHWPMDEGSGTVINDISGNGHHGTLNGNAEWTTGQANGALNFNGADSTSNVDLPIEAFSTLTTEVTIAMWVNGDTAQQPRADSIFGAHNASDNRVLNIHLPWSNGQVYWDAGGDRISLPANLSDFEGQWNHWVFTKDATAGTMTIYLNGALWHSGTGKSGLIGGVTAASFGSEKSNSNHYDGMMDEVRLYNYELSLNEVESLFNSYNAPFALWTDGAGLTSGNNSPTDDPDGDGSNLYEYFFWDSDPLVAEVFGSELTGIDASGALSGDLVFTHDRPKDLTGVVVTYQWTTDLSAGWTDDGASDGNNTVNFLIGTPGTPSNGNSSDYESVPVTASVASGDLPARIFVRVSVAAAP